MSRVSVAAIGDQPLLLAGIVALLDRQSTFCVVATGPTQDAIAVARDLQPALMVIDFNSAGEDSLPFADIFAVSSATKIVVLTATGKVDSAVKALEGGASAYILKSSSVEDFVAGLDTVVRGGTYINPGFAAQIVTGLRTAAMRKVTQTERFTVRERQIVELLLRGCKNQEIADTLAISIKTVKHYMTLLMQKLEARNRLEVVIAAQKLEGFQQTPNIPHIYN
jgi:two-component system, NarL family, nitrate/nitrite response regulator NarL